MVYADYVIVNINNSKKSIKNIFNNIANSFSKFKGFYTVVNYMLFNLFIFGFGATTAKLKVTPGSVHSYSPVIFRGL